ncbi:MAG: mechanosensitive ion channel [Thermodesulfobacteriota bacterium]|nr:mechanosensitive ion channel [Thermodesulfobacteriota bacterium]
MDHNQLLMGIVSLFSQLKKSIIEFLPHLFGAAIILIMGFVTARLVKILVARLISNVYRLIPNKKIKERVNQSLTERPISKVLSSILYWIIIVFFVTAATEALGLPVVTTWLSGVTGYLPRVLTAVLIGSIGFIGGVVVKDIVTTAAISAGIAYGSVLGRMVQVTILLITVLIALEQIGIDMTLLMSLIMILTSAFLFGAALAFGLGARTSVSNILASFYLQKTYQIGQTIKIGETKGQIDQITPTAVILNSTEGAVMVPAKTFAEAVSICLLEEEERDES